jgi:outer membrane protein
MNILSHRYVRWSLILWACALPAWAAPAGPQVSDGDLTLEQLLKNTLERNAQIQETLADVEVAKSQVDLAKAALWPKAQAIVLAAPIFEERGNALKSTSNWSHWGPFIQVGAQVVQPVYTFGMISSYRKAADGQVLAKEGLTDVKRNEVILTTKEFYYSYLMACDLESLVDDLIKFLDEAVVTAEKNVNRKKGANVKPHDLYKLKSALEDLRQRKLQARAGRQTAERAVAWVTATQFEHLARQPLEPEEYESKKIDEYVALSKSKRPEFRALKDGQEARAALRDAKRAQSYPIVFIGAFASLPWSPVRDKQPTVFANDPFNQIQGGAGLGVKFDLEFMRHSAEAAEQNAEYMKLKATESYAAPGIDLQVRKAYWELEQAREGLEIAQRRKALGKKWFVSSAMGWSIGLTPAKDLLESLEGEGLAKKNYVETVFAYNMALARLTQAVGQEVTHLKYR